jgi:uncharacterized membrane protein
MATLVAIGYPEEGTAKQARETVKQLEAESIIRAEQVASVSRDMHGRYHIETSHAETGASAGGAAVGGLWGFGIGFLFLVPVAGAAIGAGLGALFGRAAEGEANVKDFEEQVREHLQPGTSALFMVIEHAEPDQAIAALRQYGGTVIQTTLTEDQERQLEEALHGPAEAGTGS